MAFDALVSNRVGSNIPPSLLPPLDESDPSRIGTNVPPPQMIYGQPTDYPNFSPLADLSLTGVMDGSESVCILWAFYGWLGAHFVSKVDPAFMPLNPPDLLGHLDYSKLGPGPSMEGSSANEQPNPTFSMDPLGVLQFSQSIDSVSGNSVSAGPAGPQVASASKSTVKKSRRLRVGKAKTARYVSQNLYDWCLWILSRNLCAADWIKENRQGSVDDFAAYYKALPTSEQLVCNAQLLDPMFIPTLEIQKAWVWTQDVGVDQRFRSLRWRFPFLMSWGMLSKAR